MPERAPNVERPSHGVTSRRPDTSIRPDTNPAVDETITQLEDAILELLARRTYGATICPSDAARAVGSEDSWRELMEPARSAARRLVADGRVEITQRGRVVDPSTAKGPIRIRAVR